MAKSSCADRTTLFAKILSNTCVLEQVWLWFMDVMSLAWVSCRCETCKCVLFYHFFVSSSSFNMRQIVRCIDIDICTLTQSLPCCCLLFFSSSACPQTDTAQLHNTLAMHVLLMKGIVQVKFKVFDGTQPTLSMPVLVANCNRVVFRDEDAMLITAEGETAPLTSDGDDWYLKLLINNAIEFIPIDVWTLCHTCPPSWVRNLSPEMKQRERCIVREQTAGRTMRTVENRCSCTSTV